MLAAGAARVTHRMPELAQALTEHKTRA
jgi:hypothetical protein